MTVRYEWDVETVADGDSAENEDGEILDHNHCESYAEARRIADMEPEDGTRHVIVLVRDDDEGRSWAYLDEDGKLPEYFEDAYNQPVRKVAKKFHEEVAT